MKRGLERAQDAKRQKGPSPVKAKQKETKIVATATPAPKAPQKGTKEAKTKVGGKKNAAHKGRLRPELIIIAKKGDMTYADILRKVKSDPELMDLGGNIS